MVEGFRSVNTVLNQFNFFDEIADPEIQRLLSQRDKARLQKNWDLADKLREELRARGVIVQDHS
ncbi:MAG: hypothetical protein P8185_14655 [Deltaproteobacteria bacterium]